MKSEQRRALACVSCISSLAICLIASAETKVGLVGCDTSHTIAFTKVMNVDRPDFAAGFRDRDAAGKALPTCTKQGLNHVIFRPFYIEAEGVFKICSRHFKGEGRYRAAN